MSGAQMFYLLNRHGQYYTGHVRSGVPQFSGKVENAIPLDSADIDAEQAAWVTTVPCTQVPA